jgi:hypothetical protein
LSYDSLTSREARQSLRELKTTNPELWEQLTKKPDPEIHINATEADDEEDEVPLEDDSDLPCEAVITFVGGKNLAGVEEDPSGALASSALAESINATEEELGTVKVGMSEADCGRGKRKRTQNKLYSSDAFWRHHDNQASDEE